MDDQPDEKTNASRRRFAKTVLSAAAALPLLSTLADAQGRRPARRTPARPQRPTPGLRTDRNDHDTPPPVLLMEGSCIFEVSAKDDKLPAAVTAGNRRHYIIQPKEELIGNIHFAHLKIVDGSGEMLFRFDNPFKHAVTVTITDDDNDEVMFKTAGATFVADLKGTKKLDRKPPPAVCTCSPPVEINHDPSMNLIRRSVRVRYMDAGNGGRHMKRIQVAIQNVTVYDVDLVNDLPSKGEELKVMIWWAGERSTSPQGGGG